MMTNSQDRKWVETGLRFWENTTPEKCGKSKKHIAAQLAQFRRWLKQLAETGNLMLSQKRYTVVEGRIPGQPGSWWIINDSHDKGFDSQPKSLPIKDASKAKMEKECEALNKAWENQEKN